MIEGIAVTLNQRLAKEDFQKIMNKCLPFEDGKFVHYTNNNAVMLIHPNLIRGANMILKKYNIHIQAIPNITNNVNVDTQGRQDMGTTIYINEDSFLVISKQGQRKVVPHNNVEVVFQLIKINKTMMPREIWAKLYDLHRIAPELDEIIGIIQHMDLEATKKQRLLSFLFSHKASVFEGNRKVKADNSGNYYTLYWHPLQILKKLELISQSGGDAVSITAKGTNTTNWLKLARESFPAINAR
jgi:hypothetical protein